MIIRKLGTKNGQGYYNLNKSILELPKCYNTYNPPRWSRIDCSRKFTIVSSQSLHPCSLFLSKRKLI